MPPTCTRRHFDATTESAIALPGSGTLIGMTCVIALCLILSKNQSAPQTALRRLPDRESIPNSRLARQTSEPRRGPEQPAEEKSAEDQPTEDSRRRLARDIRDAVRRIQSIRTARLQQDREHQLVLSASNEKSEQLARQSADMQQSLDANQVEVQALTKQVADYQQQLSEYERRLSRLAALTARTAHRVQERAGPARSARYPEHAERLRQIVSQLKLAPQSSTPLPIQIRAARSFLETMESEWIATRSTALTNNTVAIDNGERQVHAWILDIGLVGSLFASEDGRDCGIGIAKSGEKWLTDLPADTNSEIKRMLRIARRQQPAALSAAILLRGPVDNFRAEAK